MLVFRGCFSYAKPTGYRDQWERHFPIKSCPSREIALAIFYYFSEFPTYVKRRRAMNQFAKNGTPNFRRNIPSAISGPPPEVIPVIPVGNNVNRNESFYFTFRLKFPQFFGIMESTQENIQYPYFLLKSNAGRVQRLFEGGVYLKVSFKTVIRGHITIDENKSPLLA